MKECALERKIDKMLTTEAKEGKESQKSLGNLQGNSSPGSRVQARKSDVSAHFPWELAMSRWKSESLGWFENRQNGPRNFWAMYEMLIKVSHLLLNRCADNIEYTWQLVIEGSGCMWKSVVLPPAAERELCFQCRTWATGYSKFMMCTGIWRIRKSNNSRPQDLRLECEGPIMFYT
jgi:hypothetical protein